MWKVKEGLADLVPLKPNQTRCGRVWYMCLDVDESGRTKQAGLRQRALVPWQDRQVLPSLAIEKAKKLT